MPETYYEATVLNKPVNKPCVVGDTGLCRHYVYPSVAGWAAADVSTMATSVTAYIDDEQV